MAIQKAVAVRSVWSHNLYSEFDLIKNALNCFSFVSMDTEFPGTIMSSTGHHSQLHSIESYQLMKSNVDILNLIQVGLTLSDAQGNLPDFGTRNCYVWEFNFSDFDEDRDPHNEASVELLKTQGIDFQRNKKEGADAIEFAELMVATGLVLNYSRVTWITFHGSYDFGFLIKLLTKRVLPNTLGGFMRLMNMFFGFKVFDMKYVVKFGTDMFGGLEKIANTLEVERVAGKSHQAGSDSLLTLQCFMKMKDTYFGGPKLRDLCAMKNLLFGMEARMIDRAIMGSGAKIMIC